MIRSTLPLLIGVILLTNWVACSDSGDSPTGDGGNNIPAGLSVGDATVTEGEIAGFTVSLSSAATSNVTFDYATSDGTASSASDYTATTGSSSIGAGNTSVTINVSTSDDTDVELAEIFSFTITNVVNAPVADSVAVGTIRQKVLFAAQIRPILQGNGCTSTNCHGGGAVQGGLLLNTADYNSVINAAGSHGAIIVQGNAAASNLYLKTTGSPPFGGRMPQGRPALSSLDIERLRDWINQGANNN